jgi:hypothetical protein
MPTVLDWRPSNSDEFFPAMLDLIAWLEEAGHAKQAARLTSCRSTLLESNTVLDEAAGLGQCLDELLRLPNELSKLTPNQQRDLEDLCRKWCQAGKERLQELADNQRGTIQWAAGFMRPFPADRHLSPELPGSAYDALLDFAHENLKGIERRVVELLCKQQGPCRLADLAVDSAIDWDSPYDDAWNSARRRINQKLKAAGKPWRLIRSGNAACLRTIGRK